MLQDTEQNSMAVGWPEGKDVLRGPVLTFLYNLGAVFFVSQQFRCLTCKSGRIEMAGPDYTVGSQSTVQFWGRGREGGGEWQSPKLCWQHPPAHPCKMALAMAHLVPEF